eukprot:5123037-Prymnesium_polylepis.4
MVRVALILIQPASPAFLPSARASPIGRDTFDTVRDTPRTLPARLAPVSTPFFWRVQYKKVDDSPVRRTNSFRDSILRPKDSPMRS